MGFFDNHDPDGEEPDTQDNVICVVQVLFPEHGCNDDSIIYGE